MWYKTADTKPQDILKMRNDNLLGKRCNIIVYKIESVMCHAVLYFEDGERVTRPLQNINATLMDFDLWCENPKR